MVEQEEVIHQHQVLMHQHMLIKVHLVVPVEVEVVHLTMIENPLDGPQEEVVVEVQDFH